MAARTPGESGSRPRARRDAPVSSAPAHTTTSAAATPSAECGSAPRADQACCLCSSCESDVDADGGFWFAWGGQKGGGAGQRLRGLAKSCARDGSTSDLALLRWSRSACRRRTGSRARPARHLLPAHGGPNCGTGTAAGAQRRHVAVSCGGQPERALWSDRLAAEAASRRVTIREMGWTARERL